MDDGRRGTFVDLVNGLEHTYYEFITVDGMECGRTGEHVVRPMIQFLRDAPGKGVYEPIAQRRGEVCDQCWIRIRYIHGSQDNCPSTGG